MVMPDDPYSLADLARLADVTPRTVRYYVAQGLLPSPDAAGPSTRYGEGHLGRLRLIRRLQRDHLPLAEIRVRLERMGDEEVLAAAAVLDPQEPEPSQDRDETLGFIRSLMDRAGVRPTVPGVPDATAPASPTPSSVPAALARSRLQLREAVMPLALEEASAPVSAPVSAPAPAPRSVSPPLASAPASVAPASPSPGIVRAPARTTWERLVISPDVELHVRRPLDRQANKRVDQLARIARELFEDP
jgi:DNA-binding transcriptional MerR regulator